MERFNEYAREASEELTGVLGSDWLKDLYEGRVPGLAQALPLIQSQNRLAKELGGLLHSLSQQNPARINAINAALSPLDSAKVQEEYHKYLKNFASGAISGRRINNLIDKTETLVQHLQQVEGVLSGGADRSGKRKLRLQPA